MGRRGHVVESLSVAGCDGIKSFIKTGVDERNNDDN